eukprot:TRINITY_DN12050_c0_g1_i1.p1 TRINITY_DN12050_c0_g1~~TRINITY_DN12050_c0_g1_i1.p1  ORF type:complete len:317 (-),score=14.87 TRINITY_DN12050_c0_g1_i1:98-1048(-)
MYWTREQLIYNLENSKLVPIISFLFSNGTEIIIGTFLLINDAQRIAQSLVIGVLLSKLMLTLGLCFISDRKRKLSDVDHDLVHHPMATVVTIMFITILALFIPGLFDFAKLGGKEGTLRLSRWIAVILGICGAFVYSFFFVKHWDQFKVESEYYERSKLSLIPSIVSFIIVFLLYSFEAYSLSSSIHFIATEWGLSHTFLGVILIPMLTQSAVHIRHIRHALHDSLSASFHHIYSDSLNLALFVTPIFVLISWIASSIMGFTDPMSLNFRFFEMLVTLSVIIFQKFVITDGSVVWFTGVVMSCVYFILCVSFFYHP